MTIKTANLIFQSSLSVGTSNIVVAIEPGWRTFATAIGTGIGNPFKYTIRHTTEAEYEIGVGYIVSATGYLARAQVIESSNNNALVDFTGGKKEVSCAYDAAFIESLANPAAQATIADADGTLADITTKFNTLLAALKASNIIEAE